MSSLLIRTAVNWYAYAWVIPTATRTNLRWLWGNGGDFFIQRKTEFYAEVIMFLAVFNLRNSVLLSTKFSTFRTQVKLRSKLSKFSANFCYFLGILAMIRLLSTCLYVFIQYLFVCLSACLFVSLPAWVSVSVCVSVCLCVSACLCVSLSVSVSLCPSVCLSACVSFYTCLCVSLPVCLYTVCVFLCLSVRLPAFQYGVSMCMSVRLFILSLKSAYLRISMLVSVGL
jgi:hypothetical protein